MTTCWPVDKHHVAVFTAYSLTYGFSRPIKNPAFTAGALAHSRTSQGAGCQCRSAAIPVIAT